METVSIYLVNKFLDRGIITSDKAEICKAGMELITADIINFSAVLAIGVLTKSFIYSCIYLLLLREVRRFSGGFHAKTYGVCRAVTVGTFILIISTNRIINNHLLLYSSGCNIAAAVTMLLFAPVRHPNKELTDKEIKANKLFSLVTTLFFAIVSIILVVLQRREGLVISLTYANKYKGEVKAVIGIDSFVAEQRDNKAARLVQNMWLDFHDSRFVQWIVEKAAAQYLKTARSYIYDKEELEAYSNSASYMLEKMTLLDEYKCPDENFSTLDNVSFPLHIPVLFILSSRRSGRIRNWYDLHKKLLRNDNSKIITLKGGKNLHLEHPDRIASEMISFLNKIK